MPNIFLSLPILILALLVGIPVKGEDKFIVLASTTSTVNSGLFKILIPKFKTKTGISVRVLGVGTGQAIQISKRGDADILFVHHTPSELRFVKMGFGVKRYDVMYNDFVIVGPNSDPAGVHQAHSALQAYQRIAQTRSIFLSRGDNSGTHKKSLEIWQKTLPKFNKLRKTWYRETGSGMGATLNILQSMGGYTLSDRSTWEAFNNKENSRILFAGDPSLKNQYGIIMINPQIHKHVKIKLASKFIMWIISDKGQSLINSFSINGKQTFFANYKKPIRKQSEKFQREIDYGNKWKENTDM